MSFLTSTSLARPQYVVAIAGITGNLGRAITPVFLTSYKPYFSQVIGLVRDPSKPAAKELAEKGVELRQISETDGGESLVKALQGVDVVINVLGSSAAAFKPVVSEAAVKAGVAVLFLSEFGIDHRVNPFPGFEHREWTHKAEVDKAARAIAGDKTKVISVYNSAFLEDAFGPWFGFDVANKTFHVVGSPDTKISFTSKADIGRTLAELALLAQSPSTASTIPDYVRISGDAVSYDDVKDIYEKVRKEEGEEDFKITIKSERIETFKAQLVKDIQENPNIPPLGHLRLLMAEGGLDFTSDNSNELVNPDGTVWTWKTVETFVREIKGKAF
ncbi:hypothetical protein C8Q75DRAFT_17554 [Abortiporus biennis]|nr:hypothetical protein C8Q75DRAFT_17554 [Abortiporus biennis]